MKRAMILMMLALLLFGCAKVIDNGNGLAQKEDLTVQGEGMGLVNEGTVNLEGIEEEFNLEELENLEEELENFGW